MASCDFLLMYEYVRCVRLHSILPDSTESIKRKPSAWDGQSVVYLIAK
jgi:hypothetical protein